MTNSNLNPWITRGTKQIYKNKWISVREDDVLTPAGKPGIYGVVETHGCVGIVAITDSDEVILVGQYRYPTKMYSWEIVEGAIDGDEDPLTAAKRELKEETGYEAKHWELLGGKIQLSNCFTDEVGRIYLATGLTQSVASPEETEVLTIKRVPLQEALAMVHRGEIEDGLSLIGLMRFEARRR